MFTETEASLVLVFPVVIVGVTLVVAATVAVLVFVLDLLLLGLLLVGVIAAAVLMVVLHHALLLICNGCFFGVGQNFVVIGAAHVHVERRLERIHWNELDAPIGRVELDFLR